MFHESTLSRETLRRRESRGSVPSLVWWDEAPHARPPRTHGSLWLAVGVAAIVGTLVLGADSGENSGENGVAPGVGPSSKVETPFDAVDPALNGAQLTVVRAAPDALAPLVVPSSSVGLVDGKPFVFVAEPGLRLFVATPVELGGRVGVEQRITAGLLVGQQVVVGDLSALEGRLK